MPVLLNLNQKSRRGRDFQFPKFRRLGGGFRKRSDTAGAERLANLLTALKDAHFLQVGLEAPARRFLRPGHAATKRGLLSAVCTFRHVS